VLIVESVFADLCGIIKKWASAPKSKFYTPRHSILSNVHILPNH